MKLRLLSLVCLAACVCLTTVAEAQQRGQRGGGQGGQGRGGPGGGRGGFFGGRQMGGALALANLLRMEEVRKEVDMDDDVWNAVSDALPNMRDLFQADEDERTKALAEANEKVKEVLDEVVTPENQRRLMGLLVQQVGNAAAANELIAKEIGLDADGIKKVEAAQEKAGEAMREKMAEMRDGGNFDFSKMREMMDENRKEADEAIAKVLSADQKKKLEELKGEKFEFPAQQFGGRGGPGGGPGGGRGQGGGRPGRPGNN